MTESMNVVDAVRLAVKAAAQDIPHMPMTAGRIEVPFSDAPATRAKVWVEIIGSRKRHPVFIEVDLDDGRVSETVTSLKHRLLTRVVDVVGERVS